MVTIFKDGFKKDIALLLLVSIVCGMVLANSIAYAANFYFGKTISGLIGEYGEYDLTIQVREEMKADVSAQLNKIISEEFPGARLKEGPTLTGKTTFFIALPDKYKNQQVYEGIDKYFGSLPGGGSVGIMTEPRLTLRGVPNGAQNLLLERIDAIDGVRFTFRDKSSIGVILTDINKLATVTEHIKHVLNEYQVVEISFPIGLEPANPIKLGEAVAKDFRSDGGVEYAQNVTMAAENSEMTYMVSTMMEMKRFLSAYATKVTITPNKGRELLKGDTIVLQGGSGQPLAEGAALDKANVVIQVTNVRSDKTAEGMITQGDASLIQSTQAFRLSKNTVGPPVGSIAYMNPRQQLGKALTGTAQMLQQVPHLSEDAQQSTRIALHALDNYDTTLSSAAATRDAIQKAGGTMASVAAGLSHIHTTSLQTQMAKSSEVLGGVIESMKILNLAQGTSIDGMEDAQRNINGFASDLQALDDLAQNAQKAQGAIDTVVATSDAALTKLRAFDVAGARTNLQSVASHLDQVNAIDIPAITSQVQYLAAAVPNLKDEEIAQSIALLDNFIAGQVMPGARVQVMITSGTGIKALEPMIKKEVGHENISIYTTPAGIIEPDARGELYKVLSEVKAMLAAIVSIVFTLATMLLDHTVVMSTMRKKRVTPVTTHTGWRGTMRSCWVSLTSPEKVYGMMVGSVLLTTLFVLSRASLPYVPIWLVPLIGILCGLLIASRTETVSPVRGEEILAGEAMGMTYLQIMREIVIPEGRPGILRQINKRNMQFN